MAITNPNNLTRTSNFKCFMPALGDSIMYCQGVQIPGISINPIESFNNGLRLKLEGDSYILDPVTIDFIIDENYSIVKQIFSIFQDVVHPENGTIGSNLNFECAIEVTNNTGIPVFSMELHHCALQNVGPITLLANGDDDIIVLSLSIEPSYYELCDSIEDSSIYRKIVKE